MAEYFLYIDENGNSDMQCTGNSRFLSLTGVIIEGNYDKTILKSTFDEFKSAYKISNTVLHRSDVINCKNGFEFLVDEKIRTSFNNNLIDIIRNASFKVITAVIDKEVHLREYGELHYHPYHYCLEVILERFCKRLKFINQTGTVIIESQGKKEDKALSENYARIYENGTYYVAGEYFKKHITNSQLKLATKQKVLLHKIYGLELCDLIAHPSMNYIRKINNLPHSQRAIFGGKIAEILENSKYYRSENGIINGYGIKLLP